MVRIKIAVIPHMLLLHLSHLSCTLPATAPPAPYRSHNKLVEQMTLDMIS